MRKDTIVIEDYCGPSSGDTTHGRRMAGQRPTLKTTWLFG
jgi:hypothetical protein